MARPRARGRQTLERGAFVGVARRHEQLFGGRPSLFSALAIAESRHFLMMRETPRSENSRISLRAPVGFAANEIEHLACLVGGYASVAHMRTDAGAFVGLIAESH
jgi:hypothetical protein